METCNRAPDASHSIIEKNTNCRGPPPHHVIHELAKFDPHADLHALRHDEGGSAAFFARTQTVELISQLALAPSRQDVPGLAQVSASCIPVSAAPWQVGQP